MRDHLKSTKCLIAASSGIALLCAGCVLPRCDVAPEYRSTAYQNVGVVSAPQLVNIKVEYHVFGLNSPLAAKRMRSGVVRGLTASKVFVESDETNHDRAGNLRVVIHEDTNPRKLAEAYAKGVVNGISLGLISTTSEAYYDMDITYTPLNGDPTTWTGHHPFEMTSGIKSWQKSENSVAVLQVPVELAAGMAAKFAQDFAIQNAGAAYANAVPAGAATSGVIQSAAVVAPTSAMVR